MAPLYSNCLSYITCQRTPVSILQFFYIPYNKPCESCLSYCLLKQIIINDSFQKTFIFPILHQDIYTLFSYFLNRCGSFQLSVKWNDISSQNLHQDFRIQFMRTCFMIRQNHLSVHTVCNISILDIPKVIRENCITTYEGITLNT